jgi:hypothetical protein
VQLSDAVPVFELEGVVVAEQDLDVPAARLFLVHPLGLLPDGGGWSSWFNVGALCVTRFGWACPEPGVVELHMKWMVEGTPSRGVASPTFSSMEPAVQVDEVTRHHYIVRPVIPIPGGDALTAVSFEEPVEFCRQYARGAKEIRPEEDPTYLVLPYQ